MKRADCSLAAAAFVAVLCGRAAIAQAPADSSEYFEKQVRPLLADQCLGCHGSNASASNGGLRITGRAELLKGGWRGPAIVPGHPESSLLIKAIAYTDSTLAMPPRARLTAAQAAIFTEWIRRGAPWPDTKGTAAPSHTKQAFNLMARKASHWAWQPVVQPKVPPVRDRTWVANPIDNFILAKLEAEGIAPAKSADRRTLIRRVTFDLIGLPPTPEEVAAFVFDQSPDAYAKVVDRLLASPHYGERWARHWLDLVRYAETDGHEFDLEKPGAWQYRDYVIRALNADISYKQFAIEQLAGDLLPNPRRNPDSGYNESILGTGFFWLGAGQHSPVDLMDDQADHMDNEIDVLSKTFLGIGVACARCHDHKFDAVSQKDYYGLFGILRSTRRQIISVSAPPDPAVINNLKSIDSEIDRRVLESAQAALKANNALTGSGWTNFSADPAAVLYAWQKLRDVVPDKFAAEKQGLIHLIDLQAAKAGQAETNITWFAGPRQMGSPGWKISGPAFMPDRSHSLDVRLSSDSSPKVTSAFCSGVADSGLVSDRLYGDAMSRTFTIEKPDVLYRMAGKGVRLKLVVDGLLQLRDPLYGGLMIEPDSDSMKWYVQDVSRWIGHKAYIELQNTFPGYIALDRVGFSTGGPPPAAPNALISEMLRDPDIKTRDDLRSAYVNLLDTSLSANNTSPADRRPAYDELRAWCVSCAPLSAQASSDIAALLKQKAALEARLPELRTAIAAADGTGENERVHMRGNYRTPGEPAPRRFLQACDGTATFGDEAGCGRLLLADRITSPTDPLFTRVIVNRLWQHHFGEGIVRTPDDFGVMGQRPTHPELLDWLATEFVREGGSLKRMHRLMVMSRAYRMDSRSDAKSDAADPQNLLLHRMSVRRLEAECIRDSMLTVSGRLDPTVCGPPVMPHLSDNTPGRGAPASGPIDGAGRRSIYISVRRGFPVPMLTAFDQPVPMTTIGHRTVSSVPAQALALLNDPFVVEQAGVWAKRILLKPGNTASRVVSMYEAALGRQPDANELAAATAFIDSALAHGSDELHAWSDLCHVVFNVKEFIFVR